MPPTRVIWIVSALIVFLFLPALLIAQPGATVDLNKPKKYENRVLASEKSGETKMGAIKKFNQNLNTQYNFYFNAANKVEEIVARAKQSFREDYGVLLPFYNFSLDQTIGSKQDLDSVILRCNNGILLHDLRNDWVDDLYMLMGKAYFLQKKFDSAAITFQYINFAFQPRKKDEIGYDKFVGSNMNETGNVYTISTKEKKDIVSKSLGHRPIRNDALIWMTRTLIETDHEGQAWSLVQTLKRDANFPKRLKPDLEEMEAYLYYRNNQFDSAAAHLSMAGNGDESSTEQARREYLIAQLYERSGNKQDANEYFDKAISHTVDPVLEAYAKINQIQLAYGENEEELIKKKIGELMSMAKKDKYEDYRHFIYYAAARMELQRNGVDAAIADLKKSVHFNITDPAFKNETLMMLGDLAFEQKNYMLAASSYDSLDLNDPMLHNPDSIGNIRKLYSSIASSAELIQVEDSLQKIAAMPEQQRNDLVKSLAKKLRKEKGLKEESYAGGTSANGTNPLGTTLAPDIFSTNAAGKGDWYFNNTSMKAQGFNQFRNDWGNRPNLDNWRRLSAVNTQLTRGVTNDARYTNDAPAEQNTKSHPSDISYDGLMANVPLTPEAMKASNDSIQNALYKLGKIFKDKLEYYEEAIVNYEQLINRYPQNPHLEEVLFDLYYCYNKIGNAQKAAFFKDYLTKNFNNSKYTRYINNPKASEEEKNALRVAATKTYQDVYNLFIEGRFDEALQQKKRADSTYGENYWSPQLLYIESVYYIKQRQDSLAIQSLNKIVALYPNSPLTPKATTMISVLGRRSEIEGYLTNLEVERAKEDSVALLDETPKPKEQEKVVFEVKPKADQPVVTNQPITAKVDSSKFKAPVAVTQKAGFTFKPQEQHLVGLLLDKVDVVYTNEAKNALNRYNREKFYNQPIAMSIDTIDATHKLVLMSIFTDAVTAADYVDKVKAVAATEIFPWLSAEKYSFIIISPDNLEILKTNKDTEAYRKFLKESFPGKF